MGTEKGIIKYLPFLRTAGVSFINPGLMRTMWAYCGSLQAPQREPIAFHVFDGNKLIVVGAKTALSLPEGLYLDCKPDVAWENPVLENGTLTITQAYTATLNGTTLEVR